MKTSDRYVRSRAATQATLPAVLALVICLAGCGLRAGQASSVLGQPDLTMHNQANWPMGMPNAAGLGLPGGMARNGDRLFVVDSGNNRVLSWPDVQQFVDGNEADLVIGQADFTGNSPNRGMNAPDASTLSQPSHIASCGNLYISDTGNNRVLEYDGPYANGMAASRVYGQDNYKTGDTNQNGPETGLNSPAGVAVDTYCSRLYIADAGNHRVVGYTLPPPDQCCPQRDLVLGQSDLTSIQPNEGNPSPSATSLFAPLGLAVSEGGDLYVVDFQNHRVLGYPAPITQHMAANLVIGQTDFVFNKSNQGRNSPAADTLNHPWDIALDVGGNVYVTEPFGNRVLRFVRPLHNGMAANLVIGQPDFQQEQANNGGLSEKSLFGPTGVVADPVDLVVADSSNHRVLKYLYYHVPFDNIADAVFQNACTNQIVARPCFARGVAVDANSGRLFIADQDANRVLSWPSTQQFINGNDADVVLGQPDFTHGTPNWEGGVSAKGLNRPMTIAVEASGNVWVVDQGNNRVLRFDAPLAAQGMAASFVVGQPDFTSNATNWNWNGQQGVVNATGLDHPYGVAYHDFDGKLYVSDTNNNRVLIYQGFDHEPAFPPQVIGQNDFNSKLVNLGAGGPNSSGLNGPTGVAQDDGSVYISDTGNARVFYILSPNVSLKADQLIGHFGVPPSASSLWQPLDIAVDSKHNLYVADQLNYRVLGFRSPIGSGDAATLVFGQQDFHVNLLNDHGVGAPSGVALDLNGNLLVTGNLIGASRISVFDTPPFP